jgi:hypothetical protein
VGEDHGKPFVGYMAFTGKRIDTVAQAAAGGPPARQLEGALVDINAGETDAGIGRGEDVTGQSGAATDITVGCPFTGRRNAVCSGATGQMPDMCFRVEPGGIGDGNLKTPRKRD